MRAVVRASWIDFTEPLEGGVPWLYADVRGLITIAYGNLVDPLSTALSLPLMSGGTRATQAEITAAWLTVKGDPRAARLGHRYAMGLTVLRLTPTGMAGIALAKLDANDAVLSAQLPDWEDYPACAQTALHSLAWACGAGVMVPGSRGFFPKLHEAVRARDWDAASVHIQMRETTPEGIINAGLRPRNQRNRTLMLNASRVDAYKLDPDMLQWEHVIGVSDAETLPDLSTIGDDDDTPREPVNAASHATIAPQPIVHVPPHWYRDPPDDPEAA